MFNIITSSPLIWSGLLAGAVALPILIHLINRLRHQRVRWAAMEFLLASHKKNRNWVWLKQLLLLLTRIALLLLLILTIGQVGCDNDNLSRFLGGKTTHHYVLVDDSLSMAAKVNGVTALDNARETIGMLGSRINGRDNQRVTIISFSQAADLFRAQQAGEEALALQAYMNAVAVDRQTDKTMAEVAATISESYLSTAMRPAVNAVAQLIESRKQQQAVVYILSDFRQSDFRETDQPEFDLGKTVSSLAKADASLQLIRCATESTENLAITELRPDGSVAVAGVPMLMNLQITNFGNEPARQVQVQLASAMYPQVFERQQVEGLQPEISELPTMLIEQVPPGESVTRRFPVFFGAQGQHAIRATLAVDDLPLDDATWVVTPFVAAQRVLLVNDATRQSQSVSLAMNPGNLTGLQIETCDKSRLRDMTLSDYQEFATVILNDIDTLDENAVPLLRAYVEEGGGLIFFTGPKTALSYYTKELYRDGQGVFPLPLLQSVAIPERLQQQSGDIVPLPRHPIFAAATSTKYSILDLVQIDKVCQPPPEWDVDADNSVNVLATVRGQKELPLLVEKVLGRGRVLAMLTSAEADWNNWLKNPTFPTTLLLMQDYASRGRFLQRSETTGMLRNFPLATDQLTDVLFSGPVDETFSRSVWLKSASQNADERIAKLGTDLQETARPGVYECWISNTSGDLNTSRFSVNVDHRESDLQVWPTSDLKRSLGDVPARVVDWSKFSPLSGSNRGSRFVRIALLLLLLLFVVEQVLAYLTSFHPRSTRRQPSRPTSLRNQRERRNAA